MSIKSHHNAIIFGFESGTLQGVFCFSYPFFIPLVLFSCLLSGFIGHNFSYSILSPLLVFHICYLKKNFLDDNSWTAFVTLLPTTFLSQTIHFVVRSIFCTLRCITHPWTISSRHRSTSQFQ